MIKLINLNICFYIVNLKKVLTFLKNCFKKGQKIYILFLYYFIQIHDFLYYYHQNYYKLKIENKKSLCNKNCFK